MTLDEAADALCRRLARIFLRDEDAGGRRPVFGSEALFQADPDWRDYVPFHEYFHGDTGAGVGASHQTGWTAAISYGAKVLRSTPVKDVVVHEDGVDVITAGDQVYGAAYVVDATGMRSLLANKLGWRRRDLKSHTRTIFTHMVDVPCYNAVGAAREQYGHPYRLSEGTLHHVFRGGWLWVIPFGLE